MTFHPTHNARNMKSVLQTSSLIISCIILPLATTNNFQFCIFFSRNCICMTNHINYSRNFCRLPFKFLMFTSLPDTLIGVHDSIFFTTSNFEICNLNFQSHVRPPKKFMLLWELRVIPEFSLYTEVHKILMCINISNVMQLYVVCLNLRWIIPENK
jgi:hypothetical protein